MPHPPPLVSVITPARDVEARIGAAVDSVLAQTEGRFEYVVVDHGTTDHTADVVASRADPRLRLVRTRDAGPGAARNVGLAASSAPLVAFLGGGDRWQPRFLRASLHALRSAPTGVGATFASTRAARGNGPPDSACRQPTGRADLDRLLVSGCALHHGSSLVVRRSCFQEVGGFSTTLRMWTDLEMWLRLAARSTTPMSLPLRRHLVDTGPVPPDPASSDRSARYAELEQVVCRYAPLMVRRRPGSAWAAPAVLAHRDGQDAWADRWAERAHPAGAAALLPDGLGRSMFGWSGLGWAGRVWLRTARSRPPAGAPGAARHGLHLTG